MTACKFLYTDITSATPDGPYSAGDALCLVHDMRVKNVPVATSGNACPLGRIEEATEEALKRIEKALEGKG